MPSAPPISFAELGRTGLKRWGNIVAEEFLQELRGQRGMKIYREMRDNSSIVGGCLSAIEMLIRQVSWDVEPGGKEQEDLARAEFVEQCFKDLSTPWTDVVVEHLSMLPFGFSLCEIVYKRRDGQRGEAPSRFSDGRIGWRKLAPRSQESITGWDFDDHDGIRGCWQAAAPDYSLRYLPIGKLLLFRPKAKSGNPEGRSVLRSAYRSYYFAKKIEEIEGIGIGRDLAGLPVFGLPASYMSPDATEEQKAWLASADRIVRGVWRDEQEGLVVPIAYEPNTSNKLFEFSLLSSGGERQFDTTKIVDRYDRRQALTMLHDILILGQPNTVTYKGKNMPNLFAAALGGWLDMIATIYNEVAIPRLVAANAWPVEKLPKLCHGSVEADDLGALGDFVSKIQAAGFVWSVDSGVDARLRRAAGMPKADPRQPVSSTPPESEEPEEDES